MSAVGLLDGRGIEPTHFVGNRPTATASWSPVRTAGSSTTRCVWNQSPMGTLRHASDELLAAVNQQLEAV